MHESGYRRQRSDAEAAPRYRQNASGTSGRRSHWTIGVRLRRLLTQVAFVFSIGFAPAAQVHSNVILQPSLQVTGVAFGDTICVGQQITATVICGALPAPPTDAPADWRFDWTTGGGNPFTSYNASSSSATYTAFTANNKRANSWFYGYPAGSITITCKVTPPQPALPFSVFATVDVVGPTVTQVYAKSGKMQLMTGYNLLPPATQLGPWPGGPPAPTSFRIWGPQSYDNKQTWGIFENDTVLDPAFLPVGSGNWSYVQTVNGGIIQDGVETDFAGLDSAGINHGWPYLNLPWYPADGITLGKFKDSPGVEASPPPNTLSNGAYNYTYADSRKFDLYIMYEPRPNSPGQPVAYVPITDMTWWALGTCVGTSDTAWTANDFGSGGDIELPYPTPFPTW